MRWIFVEYRDSVCDRTLAPKSQGSDPSQTGTADLSLDYNQRFGSTRAFPREVAPRLGGSASTNRLGRQHGQWCETKLSDHVTPRKTSTEPGSIHLSRKGPQIQTKPQMTGRARDQSPVKLICLTFFDCQANKFHR